MKDGGIPSGREVGLAMKDLPMYRLSVREFAEPCSLDHDMGNISGPLILGTDWHVSPTLNGPAPTYRHTANMMNVWGPAQTCFGAVKGAEIASGEVHARIAH